MEKTILSDEEWEAWERGVMMYPVDIETMKACLFDDEKNCPLPGRDCDENCPLNMGLGAKRITGAV